MALNRGAAADRRGSLALPLERFIIGKLPVTGVAHPEMLATRKEVKTMTMRVPISADALEIEVSEPEGKTIVALRGDLDASTAPQLFELFARLSRSGVTQIELDLSQLGSMDSSGLSVVVAEHKRTKHDGGGLVILSPNRRVIRLFQLSGLMSYLVVHPKMSI
jgi:anti-sigma B factor antagonist